jgi:hypothetical protein
MRSSLGVAFAVASSAAGCGGPESPPMMQGRSGMLSQTAVARECAAATRGHDRPFIVEWDATDLATFEAKAARDTVFVRYHDCKLEVVERCADGSAPGRLGAYGTPTFTSGTLQSFDIRNQNELFAKLPLGAASLSGHVAAGESLRLTYFVSGVAQNTRDALYESDLAPNAGCKGATHFVWAYSLGAFELSTSETASVGGGATVAGAGAGGRRSSTKASLGTGGKLAACESQDQRGCRVPIRLALRSISAGENPISAPGGSAGRGSGDATASPGPSLSSSARDLVTRAHDRLEAGDGPSCIDLLARARAFDNRLLDDHETKLLHARCVMVSGRCADGTRDYRAALAMADRKRELDDFQLDNAAREQSNLYCPSTGTPNHADWIARGYRELKAMEKVKDLHGCYRIADGLVEHRRALQDQIRQLPTGEQVKAEQASSLASNGFELAARCVGAATGRCADVLAVLLKQCRSVSVTGCENATKLGFAQNKAHYHCK